MLTDDEKLLIKEVSGITDSSIAEVEDIYLKVKTVCIYVWEEMKRIMNNISKKIAEYEDIKRREDWEKKMNLILCAPKDIIRNHQVLNRKPIFSHIRNSI